MLNSPGGTSSQNTQKKQISSKMHLEAEQA